LKQLQKQLMILPCGVPPQSLGGSWMCDSKKNNPHIFSAEDIPMLVS
jgi:hypothetical protein